MGRQRVGTVKTFDMDMIFVGTQVLHAEQRQLAVSNVVGVNHDVPPFG